MQNKEEIPTFPNVDAPKIVEQDNRIYTDTDLAEELKMSTRQFKDWIKSQKMESSVNLVNKGYAVYCRTERIDRKRLVVTSELHWTERGRLVLHSLRQAHLDYTRITSKTSK